jgi:competence protein ComFC
MKYINHLIHILLNILYPLNCINCKIKNEDLCHYCIKQISLNERPVDKDIYAVFDYRDSIIRKAIWELKYHYHFHLGKILGQLLYKSFTGELENLKLLAYGANIYVIPVPISKEKKRLRGFNQSLILAQEFCKNNPEKILKLNKNIVYKKIDNKPQAKITNRQQRLQNTKNVYAVKDKEKIIDQVFIVIDDVTTTGGTLNEIIKILKKNKAKKVIGLALAH